MGNLWYVIAALVLLGAAFLAGMLFERKNAAKVDKVALAVQNMASEAKKL
jgi:hypothetical protein